MENFKEFIANPQQETLWKANKKEIINYWRTLRPDLPLSIKPIEYGHTGSTYGEDGLRITGSPLFISSILARTKDLLGFENANTKLSASYRQTKSQDVTTKDKTSFVFYASVRERGIKKPI